MTKLQKGVRKNEKVQKVEKLLKKKLSSTTRPSALSYSSLPPRIPATSTHVRIRKHIKVETYTGEHRGIGKI